MWPTRARVWPRSGSGDSHLQHPNGPAAAGAAVGAVVAVSRLLSVSVRVGSVDMEETSLAEAEEDVDGW